MNPRTKKQVNCSSADSDGDLLPTLFFMSVAECIMYLLLVFTAGGQQQEHKAPEALYVFIIN